MSDEIQQATEQATAEAAKPVQLQLQDLVMVVQVIQLVNQRGAIKAEEMEAVGGLYTRLVQFLQANGALQQPQQPTPADAPATTAETPTAE